MTKKLFPIVGLLLAIAVVLTACGGGSTPATSEAAPAEQPTAAPAEVIFTTPSGYGVTLETVRARGTLICGVNSQVPGFGFVDADGNFSGVDVDYCRALAAAVFGDANAVEFRPVTAAERFTALQSGEIDVLSRNTTWSTLRDT